MAGESSGTNALKPRGSSCELLTRHTWSNAPPAGGAKDQYSFGGLIGGIFTPLSRNWLV